ncbi:formate acetyltransferase 1 [Salmonella bongori]|nr:formate acetyltransferase 1 [Salmonella bongori]
MTKLWNAWITSWTGWLNSTSTALNVIHYMHDKYKLRSLSDWRCTTVTLSATMACGIAGLSVAADSLSAIKYAKVKPNS